MPNIGQRSKCFLVAIAKITTVITDIMDCLHLISLAKFTQVTQEQTFISGEDGIIHCSALGNPAPQFKWSRKDGQKLRFFELERGSLRVSSIRREDSGTYICTIKQSRGFDSTSEKSQSIIVRVLGKKRKKYLIKPVKTSIQS